MWGCSVKHLLWQAQSEGVVFSSRSPSVLTINLNGVGVIILPPLPLPDLNPTFLLDNASSKQSGPFPPLDNGKRHGLSWKNPQASQESFRGCFYPTRFTNGATLDGCILLVVGGGENQHRTCSSRLNGASRQITGITLNE